MRKLLFTLMMCVLVGIGLTQAQVAGYSFASSAGTYTEITGGTLLRNGTQTTDSWVSAAITIPSFVFNQVTYTTAYANSNGFITLGGTAPSASAVNGVSAPGGSGISICAFGTDILGVNTDASTEMRWETVGNEIVFQWKQFKRFTVTENFSFQIRLNTANGQVKIVYQLNAGPGASTSYQPQVGIRTSATDYNNRLVLNGAENWDSSLPGVNNLSTCRFTSAAPQKNFTTGLTYTWTPPMCYAPINVTSSNLTTTTIDFNWTAPLLGTPDTYEWKVVAAGGGSGGTAIASGAEIDPDVTANVTGLTANTAYDFYIRTYCGGTDYSSWAGPYNFTTLCGSITAFPFNESFDGTTFAPTCWVNVKTAGNSSGLWNRLTSGTSPTCAPHSGAAMARFASYDYSNGTKGILVTPPFNMPNHNYKLSFWMYRDDNGTATADLINVYCNTVNNLTNATLIGTVNRSRALAPIETANGWYNYSFYLPNGTSGTVFFILEGVSANGFNMFVDDIVVEQLASCPGASTLSANNITPTSADLNWNELGSATNWNVQWGPSGFALGTGTIISTATKPYALNSLTPNSTYSFYVLSDCGGGDVSGWAGPFTFATPCNPGTIPYFEGFESGFTHGTPVGGCWTQQSVTGSDVWNANNTFTDYNRTPRTGNWNAYLKYGNEDWLFYPVQLNGGTNYTFQMYARQDGATSTDANITVKYGTANNATAMTNSIVASTGIINGAYQQVTGTFTPASSGVYYLGIKGYITSSPWYISIDDISITPTPTCPGLTTASITTNNITNNSVVLGWTEPGTATSWQIEYGTGGFTLGTGTQVVASTNPYTLQGLAAITTYDVYIRSICSVGDTSPWKGPKSFTTLCDIISTFPYSQSFDGTTFAPTCWTNIKTAGTGTGLWDRQTSGYSPTCTPHSGAGMARFNSSSFSSGTQGILVTPQLNLPNANYQIKFWMYRDNGYASNADLVNVYYNTTNNLTGATLLGTINRSNTLAPVETTTGWYEYTLSAPTGVSGGSFFIFEGVSAYGNNIFIDDIVIEQIPSCPGVVLNSIQFTNVTSGGADMAFTESGTATQWQIEYGVTGFTLGTGAQLITSTNPYIFTGLLPATTYQVYIRSICAPGDTATWKGPKAFTTLCNIISTFPYSESFNGTAFAPVCWTNVKTAGSGTGLWDRQTAGTSPTCTTHSGAGMARFNCFSYTSGTAGILVTPEFNLPNANYQVRFWMYRDYSTSYPNHADLVNVYYNTANNLTGATLLGTINRSTILAPIEATDGWYEYTFTAPAGVSGTSYFIFEGVSAYGNNVFVDDITVEQIPSCPGVVLNSILFTNPTVDGIDMGWTESGTATQWQLEYGAPGFTPGTGTLVLANTNPYTFTGLQPATTYQVYIRSICTPGDTSTWKGPKTFITGCNVYTATHIQNFDGITVPDLPVCWSKIVVSTNTAVYAKTINTSTPFSTPNHVVLYNGSTTSSVTYLMVNSPEFTDLASGNNRLRFMAKRGSTATDLVVGTITDPTDGATFTPLQTITLTNTYAEYIVNFNTYSGTDHYIAFKHPNVASGTYIYIDNFNWETIPSCLEPVYNSLSASNTTLNSVDLAWTDNGTPTEWQIEYGLNGFTQGTGTYVTANSNPFTLSGLQHSTAYQAYVRVVCAPGDTSMWRGPVAFATACGVFNVFPYTENFAGTIFPPTCWTRWTGLLAAPSTLTSVTSTWVQDDYLNVTSPVNKSAKINIYGTSVKHWLVTPSIDLGTGNDKMLSFDLGLTDFADILPPIETGSDDKFAVVISTDDGATWTSANTLRLWDNAGSAYVYDDISATGEQVLIDLSAYTGTVKIAFYGESTIDSNGDNDLFVDNVTISDIPPCNIPTALGASNMTTSTADLSWLGGTETSWEIEWDTTGFVQGNGNLVVTSDNPYYLTGLLMNTSYDFYVRALCPFDSSSWSTVYTFITNDTCYAPDTLNADNIMPTSADLMWYSTGALWEIEWGLAGFTQGTGTVVITDDNPYILSGLAEGTVYDFYVRTICDSANAFYSDWSGPYTFITPCTLVIDAFPWSDSFEDAVAPNFFPCWNTETSGGESWYVETYQPPFGNQYAAITWDATITQDEYLISPKFDFSFLAHPYVSFHWSMSYYWAVTMNNYDVYLLGSTDDGVTIDTLWSETDAGTFTSWEWYETKVDLTNYAHEPNVKIAFLYAGFDGADLYIDSVSVHDTTTVGTVKPMLTDLNVNIYPNPSNGLFNLHMLSNSETLEITVMNIQGQTVYENKLNNMALGSNTELNLRTLPAGMYHIRLSDGKTTLNKKLVIN